MIEINTALRDSDNRALQDTIKRLLLSQTKDKLVQYILNEGSDKLVTYFGFNLDTLLLEENRARIKQILDSDGFFNLNDLTYRSNLWLLLEGCLPQKLQIKESYRQAIENSELLDNDSELLKAVEGYTLLQEWSHEHLIHGCFNYAFMWRDSDEVSSVTAYRLVEDIESDNDFIFICIDLKELGFLWVEATPNEYSELLEKN